MPGLGETMLAMAWNNAWANHRLLHAVRSLPRGDFEAPRTGFFPSLKATLNHIVTVDWFYVDAMEGGTLGHAAFDPEEPFDDPAALAEAQAACDRRLVAICETGGDFARIVKIDRGSRIQTERLDRVLLHLFEHQIHHRGQAHCMLSGTPVKPPQLDEFFMADEAPLRANDFAAIGVSEEAVWGRAAS
jgi:uncharacterized damage-inducible protein DinB